MRLPPRPYLQKIILPETETPRKGFPFTIPFLQNFTELDFHPDVTIIVGENGAGKFTLIEAIAIGLGMSAEGGTKNYNLETSQNTSSLHSHLKFIRSYARPRDHFFLRAESFYNVASYMDELDYNDQFGGKSLHHQSHGESFLALLKHKLRGHGLYILDEPEAALSPQGQFSAIALIHDLVKKESQLIIATHSPIIMAYPNATILQLSSDGIQQINYEETDHYKAYKMFFQNHRGMIERIIGQ